MKRTSVSGDFRFVMYAAQKALLVPIQYGLWAATVLVQVVIAVLMLLRRMQREYAWFFAYTVWAVLRSVLLFALLKLYQHKHLSYGAYFYIYWASDVLSLSLCVSVMYAVIRRVFADFSMLRRYASIAFGVALALLLAAAIALSSMDKGGEQMLLGATLMLDRNLLFVQAGMVALTCVFAAWAALPWRADVTFGIALGFGVQATVEVIAVTVRKSVGSVGNVTYQVLASGSYLLAVLIWLLYIRAPQPAEEISDTSATHHVDLWNDALTEMLKR
jgi:hypothetical protein